MDEMKINSKFARGIASTLIEMLLNKNLGYDIDIQVNGLEATIDDEKLSAHFDMDIAIENGELLKILKMRK